MNHYQQANAWHVVKEWKRTNIDFKKDCEQIQILINLFMSGIFPIETEKQYDLLVIRYRAEKCRQMHFF